MECSRGVGVLGCWGVGVGGGGKRGDQLLCGCIRGRTLPYITSREASCFSQSFRSSSPTQSPSVTCSTGVYEHDDIW
jgi:hypothetical protein